MNRLTKWLSNVAEHYRLLSIINELERRNYALEQSLIIAHRQRFIAKQKVACQTAYSHPYEQAQIIELANTISLNEVNPDRIKSW